MCGIVGFIGGANATPILLDSLKRLEYRGYDSSGVAVLNSDALLFVRKSKGKISALEGVLSKEPLPFAPIGICHTRWATHGGPSDINSHPHTDTKHQFAVVHNGIIENYLEIKTKLVKKGVKFVSQTDTEVIAHLLATHYKGDFALAVRQTLNELQGAFAVGIICKYHPDTLIAARVGSPLIIGLSDEGNYIASDVPAIIERTRRVIYLKDGQMAVIKKGDIAISTFDGKKAAYKVDTVAFSVEAAKKNGFAHFMLKEIHEQPTVVQNMLDLRLKNGKLNLEGLDLSVKKIQAFRKVGIVACGTAYHAGMVAKYALEEMARISVEVDTSSEFRYRNPIVDKNTLIIAISQSGETADTLAAVKEAKRRGATIVAICNVIGSSLAREADGILYTHAGPEIGVASTKAYTAQLLMMYLLTIHLGQARGTLSSVNAKKTLKSLAAVPALYKTILDQRAKIQKVAEANSHFGCFLFLGRNVNFPSALEGALKLKEVSYIPAEGYAAGEMKHGPIALIDEYRAVVCIAPQSHVYEKMVSNIQEIKARKGTVIAVVSKGDKHVQKDADYCLEVPLIDEILSPLLVVLPLQLMAYYVAVKRGCDVDQPRNLAKSVTVE